MLKNYFKIAYRNIFKNSIFSLINILGLAIGVASTVLVSYYVKHERSYEEMHENAENIFRLSLDLYNGSEFIINDTETYQLLGAEFTEKMPEVKGFVRMAGMDVQPIKANDRTFYEERIYCADPSVFDIFSYEVLLGDPKKSFSDPYKAVFTRSMALKYFGQLNVIGETFQLANTKEPVEIVAVMEDVPQNTHLKFDVMISHTTLPLYWTWYEENLWGGNNEYTYLLMNENTDVAAFNEKLEAYSKANEHLKGEIIISEKIGDIHLHSNKSFEPEVNGSAQVVNFMLAVAIFIIIIAWVNYVNLSTSRAVNRAKEVGVRKAVGSLRSQLVKQFLLESFLINFLACLIAFTIVQMSMPAFKSITGQTLPSNLFSEPFIWGLLLIILVVGTTLSGVYPAFVLSSFKPSAVLKGKFSNSSSGLLLRKGLVVFQFLTTVVLIAVSIAIYFQIDHLKNQDLGIDIDNTVVLRRPNLEIDSTYLENTKSFAKMLTENPLVANVAQNNVFPGASIHELNTNDAIRRASDDPKSGSYNYYSFAINENFIPTYDVKLISGRNFVEKDDRRRVIINQRAVETLGFSSPEEAIGKKIRYGTGNYLEEIVGVVESYRQRSPKEELLPMIFKYSQLGNYITVKLSSTDTKLALTNIQSIWSQFFPDSSMDYQFLSDTYTHQYKTDQVFSSVVVIFTGLSLFVALLGLFGLSAYTILQRRKEIGVRKVLGATYGGLIVLLSRDFLKLVIISALLSIPLAYYIIVLWLENYDSRIEITWWLFAIPLVLIVSVAFLSVLGQTLKSALANPADSLRYE